MKKVLLAALISLQLGLPQKSHALLSGGGSTFTAASAIYLAGGLGAFAGGAYAVSKRNYLVGALLIVLSVILLDEKNQSLEFSPIVMDSNNEQAQYLARSGVTSQDIVEFNSQIEELNLTTGELIAQAQTGSDTTSLQQQFEGSELKSGTKKVAATLLAPYIASK